MEEKWHLKHLWPPDQRTNNRQDYLVFRNGKRMGRIYNGAGRIGRQWYWAAPLVGLDHRTGLADDLEQAKAQLRAAWNSLVEKYGIERMEGLE